MDKCECEGEMLNGLCPSQPGGIKCCLSSETSTSTEGLTTEAAIEICQTETTISQCLAGTKRRKRSTGCSSKYSCPFSSQNKTDCP